MELSIKVSYGPVELTSMNSPQDNFVAVSRVYTTIDTTIGTGQTFSFFNAEAR